MEEKKHYMALVDMGYKRGFWFSNRFKKLTDMEAKKYGDKIIRRDPDKVIIEKALHPTPKVESFDLLHEHKGGRIVFSLWKGNDKIGNSMLSFDRQDILNEEEDFYKNSMHIFRTLLNDIIVGG